MPRRQSLRRAAHITGDRHALRRLLKVPMNDLYDWLAGYAKPPTHVFLQAVDIIDGHASRQARRTSGSSR
jgi:hypothetical protein